MLNPLPKVFGSPIRTRILVALVLLERSYPRELARITESSLMSVQRICNDLEIDGIVASRIIGQQREVQLNPRYFAYKELSAYLLRLQEALPDLRIAVEALRRRPRRAGKPL